MTRRILVALDDSPASQRAAEFVNRFFDGAEAEIVAVNVSAVTIPWLPAATPGIGVVPFGMVAPEPPGDDDFRQAEAHGRRTVSATGIETDAVRVDFGDPVTAIESAARDHDVDLVVVGSGEKGWWRRVVEGSVSEDVVRALDRPVLVVH